MKCKNCGKEIVEHGKFYIFEYDNYYPAGTDGDLRFVTNDMNKKSGSLSDFRDVWYACGNTIYDAEFGEEISPFVNGNI